MNKGPVSSFIQQHFRHFNAAALVDASKAYESHLQNGGKMLVTLAGAMSTAELGQSLAEMIRRDLVHAISCTGANLEEDIFNLVAHEHYERVPHYRELSGEAETELMNRGLNRVTDTCIPEEEAMRKVQRFLNEKWAAADSQGKSYAPHQFLWSIMKEKEFQKGYQINPKDSWMVAAMEKNIPIFTPGWEDSTLGNFFAAALIKGIVKKLTTVEHGIPTMLRLAQWYQETTKNHSIGFFQIGGGIAGDFPICVVPMLEKDLKLDIPRWGYFCQISDSTTSYGSYSGATPNEKITWGKLEIKTPKFIIESDATIVAPLIFAYLLGW